ncbi:hypothetical protein B0A49_09500, partial [Cryomyces minteri]
MNADTGAVCTQPNPPTHSIPSISSTRSSTMPLTPIHSLSPSHSAPSSSPLLPASANPHAPATRSTAARSSSRIQRSRSGIPVAHVTRSIWSLLVVTATAPTVAVAP